MIFEEIETGVRYNLADFGLDLQSGHEHPSPPTRDKVLYISGKHGAWDFGADLGPRPINLPVVVLERTRAELQIRIRKLTSFLFDAYAQPKTFKLFFDYEMDKYYYVRFSGQIRPERLAGLGTFIIPLIAYDPFAYAESTYKDAGVITGITYDSGYLYPVDPNEVYMDSEVYTMGDSIPLSEPYTPNYYYENPSSFDWRYPRHYSGVHTYSAYHTPLIVEIEGTVTNPRITNQATGKIMSLPSISGQKMTVDTGKYSVKVNGAHKLMGVEGIENFTLANGENSLLFEGESPNATVTFKWKHKFM